MKTKSTVEEKKPSEIRVRMEVQVILQKNLRTPVGMFHGKELNERCFMNDLFKNFDITPKKA